MKKLFLLLLLGFSFSFAQGNYKYVVVPLKFSFFNENNKYNLNAMTKSFFEREGFEAFYDTDQFPKELAQNRCSALFVNVIENNNLFVTKINIEIKDCYNKVLLVSDLGSSREKEYQKAYVEAFRIALSSVREKLKSIEKGLSQEEIRIEDSKNTSEVQVLSEKFTAVATELGYNLVNEKSVVVFNLQKTSNTNIFTATKGVLSGILIKKNSGWFFEYYEEEKLISQKVDVKF
ncbi:hypothetical protein [Flavobacterium sp. UBA6195]|uniref:hypothetical protein n=1 Tax=Flavobacterium sp. UBA6195 TaxID=1946554 RepID=UPI0025C1C1CA|nr:hypothetical protein [Flavobacterium sp. UBA6195]